MMHETLSKHINAVQFFATLFALITKLFHLVETASCSPLTTARHSFVCKDAM